MSVKLEMENKTSKYITQIERVLDGSELTKRQQETLAQFDHFNELEANCSLGTRKGYLDTLHKLGVNVRKPDEKMTREDLQTFIHAESRHHKEGTIQLFKQHLKRFFKWLEWARVSQGN